MLIYSMSVSVDGFIADREGAFGWSVPSDELFRFHLDQVRGLGSCLLGRRLYETMLVWETDPSLRDNEDTDAFADVWSALPKVVFSRTLDGVQGNARLAEAPLAEEVAAALDATESSAQRPNSRLLSAEGHCVRTLNTWANLRTRSLRQAPRCDRARAAQQGAYGHKAGV